MALIISGGNKVQQLATPILLLNWHPSSFLEHASGAIAIAGSFCSLQHIDFSWKRHSEHVDFAAEKSEQHFQPHVFRRFFFFQPTCASLLAARRGIMHFTSHFDVEDLQGKNLGFLSSHWDLGITCCQVSHVFQRHLHQGWRPGDVNTVFSG